MQSGVLVGAAPYGLPLEHKILPEFLNDLGYKSIAVGKWHLGSFSANYTPTHRGFDSHLGYWTGRIDYYDHTSQELYGPVVSWATGHQTVRCTVSGKNSRTGRIRCPVSGKYSSTGHVRYPVSSKILKPDMSSVRCLAKISCPVAHYGVLS